MPRFERPTCRVPQSLQACLQKWDCLELEWSIWHCCLSWIFLMKIRVNSKANPTVKQIMQTQWIYKIQYEVRVNRNVNRSNSSTPRDILMLQPVFYYPIVHVTKTFNKLKFSLCKWASKFSILALTLVLWYFHSPQAYPRPKPLLRQRSSWQPVGKLMEDKSAFATCPLTEFSSDFSLTESKEFASLTWKNKG